MLLICSALPRGTRLPSGGAEVYFAAFPPGASVIELQAAVAAGCNNARASLIHLDSGLTCPLRSNHLYPLYNMAGIPTDQLAPIDQAAKYASTDPAKAEDIYREILSKKAGECAKIVVVIGALISSRRGWSAGSGDSSGQAWGALQGSQVSSLRPSLTAGSRIAKRRSSLSSSLTHGHLCRRSPKRRRLSLVSPHEPGDVLEANVSPHAHRLLPRISTRPADASHE